MQLIIPFLRYHALSHSCVYLYAQNDRFALTLHRLWYVGATFRRLWVGQFDPVLSEITLSISYNHGLDEELEMISLVYHFWGRNGFSMHPSVQNITLKEAQCLDVKITLDRIWILKDDELVSHMLTTNNREQVEAFSYALQEEEVAEQLFQSSEHQADEILQIACSIFSSSKEDVVPFVSSIFLRRLLLPGVHHNVALHATLAEYSRHLPESELQALTADGLKKEVLSLIEHEVGSGKLSGLHSWKRFLTRYFCNWCKNNAIYGLLVDSSTHAVGLIRKSSVSIFRSLEYFERILEGSSDEVDRLTRVLDLVDDDLDYEIVVELFRCVMSFSQQLGKTASSIFYESVLTPPVISSEDIVHCIVKILETGSCISGPTEKELMDHKSLRKLSAEMFLSVQSLYEKASGWNRILNVIEGFSKLLLPRKTAQKFHTEVSSNINSSIIVHATYQISKVMFESAWDFLLFSSYLVDIGGQVHLSHDDITRIQREIVPMLLQEIIFGWLIINFFAITPSAPATTEDVNSKLSSLHIDCNTGKQLWNEKLGRHDNTLAFILLLNVSSSSTDHGHLLERFPNMQSFGDMMSDFISWIRWGQSRDFSMLPSCSIDLAFILFKHGQYEAVEQLLMMVEAHLLTQKTSRSSEESDGGWCIRHHLLGCCLLAQVQCGLHTTQKDIKVFDAIRCFFRSSSGKGASEALQSLPEDVGIPYLGFSGCASMAAWKLQYYQWAMQLFERYSISEGAYEFALAALEQVDEAMDDENNSVNGSITTTRGRLWANVFIFALDLGRYYDAYCAIVSNPDEESKYICLRRFINVLYEQGAIKILCSNKLPLIGLVEKVEQELAWKAERSDISAKPNLYKLLYAFQMRQHNWRRAANYMYMYSTRLRTEAASKDYQGSSLMLQEKLNALSAAVNSLHLVDPAYAWIEPPANGSSLLGKHYPSKKAKRTPEDHSADNDAEPERWQSCIDVEKLENEFVLTSAEYMLSLVNVRWTFSGKDGALSDLAELLVNNNLYDMAFTILLRFFKGSALKRELERVLSAISLRCCLDKVESSWVEEHGHGSPVTHHTTPQTDGSNCWATLKIYLEKYKEFHGRLPVIVTETLLRADPRIELPFWLVQLFKLGQKERMSGMSGGESNPSSLFQLYVSYGRYTEATNLLLECIQSFAPVRPADIVRRKKPFAAWFPYTTIERLLYQLEELTRKGHMVEQWDELKKMLLSSLQNHLKTINVDSKDAIILATPFDATF
ncbi:nuclear pore complex protein NUP160 [Arachis duranensis]|uniref:Nuclear pore complex protein NUP160 n=1 Tax=Arachis duranensis TaxID=130453 RepID=A0A9C6TI81_ARADU|nr:nuclear pore complex protein NUP160 [Arachis duranensis]